MSDEKKCLKSPDDMHCWCSDSDMQHMMTGHRDRQCCWCNADRCFYAKVTMAEGHGPYAPNIESFDFTEQHKEGS